MLRSSTPDRPGGPADGEGVEQWKKPTGKQDKGAGGNRHSAARKSILKVLLYPIPTSVSAKLNLVIPFQSVTLYFASCALCSGRRHGRETRRKVHHDLRLARASLDLGQRLTLGSAEYKSL